MWDGYWSPDSLSELVGWIADKFKNPMMGKGGAILVNLNVHTPDQEVVDALPEGMYVLPYFYAPAWAFITRKLLPSQVFMEYTLVTYDTTLNKLSIPKWFKQDIDEDLAKKMIEEAIA